MSKADDALDYFRRMRVEPTPYGILRWIDRGIELEEAYDRKYARRLIEALVEVCDGHLGNCYKAAELETWEDE